jgi:HEPN domain-containing protein
MPLDPERVAEARGWFVKAEEDLRAADFERTALPPLSSDIVFHAQQAAEKAMKGFLTWHDQPFRKTHNLVEIGEACAAADSTLEELLRRTAPLTEYAWKFRYPGEPELPTIDEAEAALALAREVYDAILDRLPPEVRP